MAALSKWICETSLAETSSAAEDTVPRPPADETATHARSMTTGLFNAKTGNLCSNRMGSIELVFNLLTSRQVLCRMKISSEDSLKGMLN